MNWIEKTLEEYWSIVRNAPGDDADLDGVIEDFWKRKLLESYKNGAQAERRKASKKPGASAAGDA